MEEGWPINYAQWPSESDCHGEKASGAGNGGNARNGGTGSDTYSHSDSDAVCSTGGSAPRTSAHPSGRRGK